METIIVCGAPASGKTTYVKNNMSNGDFVVDLDALRQAVTFSEQRTPVNNLTSAIFDIRNYIYSMIESGQITAPRCWIVASLPKQTDREKLAARFKAKIVSVGTTEEECISRSLQDKTRDDKEFQIQIITNYFTTFYNDRKIKTKETRDKTIARYFATLYNNIDD